LNWISNVVRPKIRGLWTKRESPDNLWVKCPESGEMVFHKDLEANQFVFPSSGYHQRLDARTRLRLFFDQEKWEPLPFSGVTTDPLKFRDERRYTERLKAPKPRPAGRRVLIGAGESEARQVVAAVQDFDFMGGSLGMAAAEAIIAGAIAARDRHVPYVLFAGSGGARMQEGILSLMQLPRTTIAVQMVKEAGLPYIVVLTNPTTGGVTASYAMLGDVPSGRARRADRLRRPARHRADHSRKIAGRLPALRISARSTAWSTWSCTATRSAKPSPASAGS
jgi:acetyl-CoA carboxylase carboxyl transferase subunit beta